MKTLLLSIAAVLFLTTASGLAQEDSAAVPTDAATSNDDSTTQPDAPPETEIADKAKDLASETQAKVEEVAEQVDQNPMAQKAADGVLGPIYKLAESLNFAAFHWLAFAIMASGVVSFALQLVLGKLALLFRGSLNLREIFSDAIGLIISVVGLVLTTQAAAENSTFTHSPAAVLSAAATGILFGFVLYRWGQAQEVHALTGRRLNPDAK
jgi:ABC-type multidrug transport system fused ATPase/permease subunit